MTSRIRYQQLLKLTRRQISSHCIPHQGGLLKPEGLQISPAARTRLPLFAAQCPRQTFSTTRSRPQNLPKTSSEIPIQETPSFPEPDLAPKPPKKKQSRTVRRWIFIASFILLGSIGGSSFRLIVSPPPPPSPNTPEDEYTIEVLHEQAAKLPVVRQLSADPAYESWDAYTTLSDEHKAQHLRSSGRESPRNAPNRRNGRGEEGSSWAMMPKMKSSKSGRREAGNR